MKRICLLVLLLPFGLWAQTSKVRGQVTDATDGSPIPYASVFFEGTSISVSTDEDGRYYIETRDSNALVLTAQMLGYVSCSQPVTYGVFTEINFILELDADLLTAARIRPDDSYLQIGRAHV